MLTINIRPISDLDIDDFTKVGIVMPKTKIYKAFYKMSNSPLKTLLVKDKGKAIGILSLNDFQKFSNRPIKSDENISEDEFKKRLKYPETNVEQIMTTGILSLNYNTNNLSDVINDLLQKHLIQGSYRPNNRHSINQIYIENHPNEDNRIGYFLSYINILNKINNLDFTLNECDIKPSLNFLSVEERDSVKVANAKMKFHNVRQLIVNQVQNEISLPVGVISDSDILSIINSDINLENYIVKDYTTYFPHIRLNNLSKLEELVGIFVGYQMKFRIFPIYSLSNEFIGVIEYRDILRKLT